MSRMNPRTICRSTIQAILGHFSVNATAPAGFRCPFWKRRGAEKQRIAEKDSNLFYLCVFSFPPSSAFPKAEPIPFKNHALCN